MNLDFGMALIYADPGSGVLMLQLAAVAVSSVLFYFRKAWFRLFSRRDHKPHNGQRD